MRKIFSILLTLLVGGCGIHGCEFNGSCDQTVPAGQPWSCSTDQNGFGGLNQPCNNDTCNPGLTCSVGNCIPCANAGEACCGSSKIHGGSCNPGLTCVYDGPADWYMCEGCGATIGGACCPNNAGCSVGMCMDGTCQDTSQNKCMGSTSYWVWVVDSNCVATKHGFSSGTIDDANQCVAETLAVQFPASQGYELGPIGLNPDLVAPQQHDTCPTGCSVFGTSNMTVQFDAFSTTHLHLCEHNKDPSCTMWADNACPGD